MYASGPGARAGAPRRLDRGHAGDGRSVASVADAVVIGAGPNGLVAANLLADAGWDVEVLEAEPEPGGAVRSGETCEPGFVHDRFSSFYPFATISSPLLDFGLDAFGLRWRRSDAVLAHVSPDAGRVALLEAELAASCAAFDADSPGDGEGWRVLSERWRRLEGAFAQAFFSPFPPLAGPARMAARTDAGLLAGTALHADLPPEAVGRGAFGWIMCGLGQHNGPRGCRPRTSTSPAERSTAGPRICTSSRCSGRSRRSS